MKKYLISLCIVGFSSTLFAQNAFDQRITKPKKPYSGTSIGNAETISGKNKPSTAIKGDFPLKFSLNKQFKDYDIIWDENGQLATSITPKIALNIESSAKSLSGNPLLDGVFNQLQSIKKLLQLQNPSAELVIASNQTDELGFTHLKFKQYFGEIRVIGGEIIVHIKDNAIESITNRLYPTPSKKGLFINIEPIIETITKEIPFEQLDELGNTLLTKRITSERVIYHIDNDFKNETYCYRIEYRPNLLDWWEIIANGLTGKIITKVNKTCSVDGPKTTTAFDLKSVNQTINTYQVGSTYYLLDASRTMFNASFSSMPNNGVGVIRTLDANFTSGSALQNITSTNNLWNNKTGVSAHRNAAIAYEYFRTIHNRNSINGTGGNVTSIINVNNKNGTKMDNAYWNGEMMFYGNGNTAFTPLAGSLDVAGHEMTHGVVQNTAGLEYQGQSGAINESMADIFGSLMDRDDWQIGDDITKTTYIPSGALRDLSDPHNGRTSLSQNGYQPKTMSEYYTGTNDNGGVHINSGIVNYAYYLIANTIGKDKAEKIYYRALTTYLTSQSQFIDLRKAVIKSAEDLYGNVSTESKAGITAFNTVGIYGYNGTGGGGNTGNGNGEVILSANPGTEGIVSYNTDLSFSGTFYTSTNSGAGFVKKTETTAKRKCSVTDDGSLAYFVSDEDDRIVSFSLGSTSNETYISAAGDAFDNVAISKNGKRLAAITTEIDSSIYIYDFTIKQWKQFKLYNPTFTDGINTGGVLYADGLEWDYSGQYVVYDAKNFISSSFGSDITWWDIGIIKVWDNAANTWGDGTVQKLFNQLNDNISIGNPTFAKNTGNIIAFDVIDDSDNSYAIYGKNTVTGKSDEITSATQIGFPNYSNKDDKLIYDAKNTSDVEVLAVISLGADKITKSGTPTVLISDAKWGTWYAQGTRALLSSAKDIISFSFPYLTPAPPANFSGTTITFNLPPGTDITNMNPTFILSSKAEAFISGVSQTSGVSKKNFTNPVTYTVKAEDGTTKNYTVVINLVSSISKFLASPISIYPNPAAETVRIQGLCKSYSIFDITGQKLLEGKENTIDIHTLGKGIYTVSVELLTGETVNLKLVKE